MNEAIFTISLDFELHWGVMPRMSIEEYKDNLEGVRKSLLDTLELFEKYGIHATWATVGFLFFQDKKELLEHLPNEKPFYENKKYDSYSLIKDLGYSEKDAPFHFAPSLIDMIVATPHQEIATHTFSHFFCLEEGQTIKQFREDLSAAVEIARKKHIFLESIVFPRNQFNQDYLKVCQEYGIKNVRGNPGHSIYRPRKREEEHLIIRLLRLSDTYVNISGKQIVELQKRGKILDIPASRFFRPYNPKLSFLDSLRIKRIKNEMKAAAKKKKTYHLWWHPHNFGIEIEKNLQSLETVLQYYVELNRKYEFKSLNMKEIRELYERR